MAEGKARFIDDLVNGTVQNANVVENGEAWYNNTYENNIVGGNVNEQQNRQNDGRTGIGGSYEIGNLGESGRERRLYGSETQNNGGYQTEKPGMDGRGNSGMDGRVRSIVHHKEPLIIINEVRSETKHGACVDNPNPEDYSNGTVKGFVSADGEATISVRDNGDIVAFGKTKDCKDPHAPRELIYIILWIKYIYGNQKYMVSKKEKLK